MKPVNNDVSFPKLEEEVLAFWKANSIVEKGLKANKGKKKYVFYDGPPFATGTPHYGHIVAGTIKDIVPRYWVMRGFEVERKWGWDCHGLPVEFEMEKELGLNGVKDIERFGVANFNDACRGIVLRYSQEWEETITRTGRWADFKNSYRTMDTNFMESVWWAIKELWKKGLIYQSFRVMPYSWRIGTPLSNFEASLNYKEVQDPALTVKFKEKGSQNRYFLAWTTTPWTLPSNMALSMGRAMEYKELKADGEIYIVGKNYSGKIADDVEEVGVFPSSKYENVEYEPLFPYFKNSKGAFKVLLGDHVSDAEGTGIVHTAPAFGEDDFAICQKYNVPLVNPVDKEGNFTDEVSDYKGQNVKEADKNIIKDLKAKGAILKHDTIVHNYPFCWRSDTPLIYRAVPAWFVKIDPFKPQMIENNKKIHWVPEHLRDGRFGNWLENSRDWNISRNRFWGTPIPIWECDKGCRVCIGSLQELEERSGKKLTDIHKQFVDPVTLTCENCKGVMRRIPEVLDCWFESGSMPYAQQHYPFENRKEFDENFPANFIAEGIDQTRGWFYTLSVLSTALHNKPPFQNVIVNGLVLAEDGKKMSKRLKNYPDPKEVLDNYGADALRMFLVSSPASRAEEMRFSETGVKEIIRSVILPFWNSYSFFVTYANADGWKTSSFKLEHLNSLQNDLDRWILSRLQSLVTRIDRAMEQYHLYEVLPEIMAFINELTNWYIRLSRARFWDDENKPESKNDKQHAYSTLYYVITQFNRVLAPVMPFLSENLFQNLERDLAKTESVHLSTWPKVESKWIDTKLEKDMKLIEDVVVHGRIIRSLSTIKNRQPLKELVVITSETTDKTVIEKYSSIILDELNVKKLSFSTNELEWVEYKANPNAKVLGPFLGPKMKAVFPKLKELSHQQLLELQTKGFVEIDGVKVPSEHIPLNRTPKKAGQIESFGKVTLWLDTTLDDKLISEGRAREAVNRIQKLRKDTGLNVSDRIRISYSCDDQLKSAIETHKAYISEQTLSSALEWKKEVGANWGTLQDIDGLEFKVRIERES